MRPRKPIYNHRNITAADTKHGGYLRTGFSLFVEFSYFKDFNLSEFYGTIVTSMIMAYIIYWTANVLPNMAGLNMIDIVNANAIFIGQFLSLFAIGKASAYFDNLGLSQLGFGSIFTKTILSIFPLVFTVSLWSIPTEIANPVIVAIIIIMASLHAFWARADKSFQNKTMDLQGMDFSITGQEYPKPFLTIRGWFKNVRAWPPITLLIGTNIAQGAGLIKREAGNRFPLFHNIFSFKYIIPETTAQCQADRG